MEGERPYFANGTLQSIGQLRVEQEAHPQYLHLGLRGESTEQNWSVPSS